MGQKQSSTASNENCTKPVKLPTKYYDDQLLKRCKNVHFDVESWYKLIENETFNTTFIPITPSIAQAFINFYQTRYSSTKSLTSNDIQLIESVQNQLKEQISHTNDCFVRLSARSPKDGIPLNFGKIKDFYNQKLNELKTQYPDGYESIEGKTNMQMIAYIYGQFHSLKVTDEIQALNLILSSERVYYDLNEVLDCEQVKNNQISNLNHIQLHHWNNNIIIRQWNHLLDPSMEFRCFVYQSNLTAITQYNDYCNYYHLQDQMIIQQIKLTIITYWRENIQPILDGLPEKYSNYIIDIGLIENKLTNEYNCIVIEINPFETTTGASLFHWTIDNDQLTGQGQGHEIEIRIRSDYHPYLKDYVDFILEVHHLDGNEKSSTSDHSDQQPYSKFLDQMKSQLSSASL